MEVEADDLLDQSRGGYEHWNAIGTLWQRRVATFIDENGVSQGKVKARDLAGQNDMLFIRHSQTGQVQCRTNKAAIELNEKLHAHN